MKQDTALSVKVFSDKLSEMSKKSGQVFLKLFKGLTAFS